MRKAVIVSAVRTPVGKCRGALASVPAHELAAPVIKEAVKRAGIRPSDVDGFSNPFAHDIPNLARVALLTAGFPTEVPGLTLDRQCGSSLNAVAYAAILIEAGYADIMLPVGQKATP